MNPVTSNAVANYLVMTSVTVTNLNLDSGAYVIKSWNDYGLDFSSSTPYLCGIYNRSRVMSATVIGDGSSFILYNTGSEISDGEVDIAVIYKGMG